MLLQVRPFKSSAICATASDLIPPWPSAYSPCRHVSLQLEPVCRAADPVAAEHERALSRALSRPAGVEASCGTKSSTSGNEGGEQQEALAPPQAPPPLSWQGEVVRLLDSLRTELGIAAQLLEVQSGSAEVLMLATVPAEIAQALAADLQVGAGWALWAVGVCSRLHAALLTPAECWRKLCARCSGAKACG